MRTGLVLMFIFLVTILSAEWTERFTISYHAGYNLAQHYGTKDQATGYDVKTIMRHGYTTGVALKIPITKLADIIYELNYVTKGSNEEIRIKQIDGEDLVRPAEMNVDYLLDYIEVPILFNIKVLKNDNFSLSTLVGTAMALKVNGKYALDGTIYFPDGAGYSAIPIHDKSNLTEVNMFDYSLIYGGKAGFCIGKIPLEVTYKFTIGWDYLNLPTYQAGGFDPVSLRNQSYSLSIGMPFYVFGKGNDS